MLKIEYQIKMMDLTERRCVAYINADNAAAWLCKTTELYGKIGIISVEYHD